VAAAAPADVPSAIDALAASPRGSEARARLIAFLAERGAEAAPLLSARLPGPLEPVPPEGAAPELGPLPAALAALGASAVRPLLAVLGDGAPERRRVAAALLGHIGAPEAWPALADRALDPDPEVSAAARGALAAHRRDPALRTVPERLRRALLSGIAVRSGQAARALGALRDVEAIPLLIQVLETSEPGPADAAAGALAAITLQRLGPDARRWLGWWKQNRGRGRAEWLFSGLTSEDREVRLAADADLRAAAPSPVPYAPDMPPAERERAARAWAGWWARSGQVL
jgi:HEAT repeat protein